MAIPDSFMKIMNIKYTNRFRGLFLLVPFIIIASTAFAQQVFQITGTVNDEGNTSFPNVSLRLGLERATMTNNEGGFSIRIPIGSKDSLRLSYIGYKTLFIPPAMIKDGMVIRMNPIINQLQEVSISGITGANIIQKAIANIPLNYPQFPFESIGFYREVGKLDTDYLSFAEAGIHIMNEGYSRKKKKDRIIIDKERNLKYVGERAVKNPFGAALKGVPYVVLDNDVVKNPGAIFGQKFIEKYNYKLSGSTMVDQEEAYIVSFDQKEGIKEALYQGEVVIIKHSFAIASIDFELSKKGKKYATSDVPVFQRPILSLLGYHFEKKNEELSLRYYKIEERWYPYFYSIATKHQVRARKQKIEGELSIRAELFISKINKVPTMHYNGANVMSDDYSFQNMVAHYSDDYWKEFDYIKSEQSLKKLIDQQSGH